MPKSIKTKFSAFTYYLYLNILFLLFSFLGILITVGASLAALFDLTRKQLNDAPPPTIKSYFESFKQNFIPATIVWLLIVINLVLIYFVFNYLLNNPNYFLMILLVFSLYQTLLLLIYSFPIIARFKTGSFFTLLKNILLISNINIITNLKLLASFIVPIVLVVYVHSIFLLVVFIMYAYLVTIHLKPVFKKIEDNMNLNEEEEIT